MSLRGIFALVLEAILLIMALGSDIREILIAAVCLGGLLVFSLLSVLWSVVSLRFGINVADSLCQRGQSLEFTLNVKGILLFPVVCKITIKPPYNEEYEDSEPLLNGFILSNLRFQRRYNFSLELLHTGKWTLGIKNLYVRDIFGFFTLPLLFTPRKSYTEEITVMPKFHFEAEYMRKNSRENFYNGVSMQNSEAGDTFDDSRAYRDGDPLRRIHWKQSVKTGKVFTRLFENPREPKIIIALDYRTLETQGAADDIYRETTLYLSEYFAEMKTYATVLLLRTEDKNWEFALREREPICELQQQLADLNFKIDEMPLDDIGFKYKELSAGDRIFLITSNPHKVVMEALTEEENRGVRAGIFVPRCENTPITHIEDAVEEGCIVPVIIENPDEIPKEVGKVL